MALLSLFPLRSLEFNPLLCFLFFLSFRQRHRQSNYSITICRVPFRTSMRIEEEEYIYMLCFVRHIRRLLNELLNVNGVCVCCVFSSVFFGVCTTYEHVQISHCSFMFIELLCDAVDFCTFAICVFVCSFLSDWLDDYTVARYVVVLISIAIMCERIKHSIV